MIKGLKNMGNMANIVKQAQKAQKELQAVQSAFKGKVFEEKYAQDNITLAMNGEFEVKSIKVNPDFVDPEDMEMFEESLAYAFNNMYTKVDDYRSEKLKTVTSGLPTDGLGDLGKLLG
jgi:DNA-binding YbaB/EbfC family protein